MSGFVETYRGGVFPWEVDQVGHLTVAYYFERLISNSSIRLFHKMFNARTGELAATLDQFGVHLDVEARRPAPLPETLRQRAKAMLAPVEPV